MIHTMSSPFSYYYNSLSMSHSLQLLEQTSNLTNYEAWKSSKEPILVYTLRNILSTHEFSILNDDFGLGYQVFVP
jgi:hypothetical protein